MRNNQLIYLKEKIYQIKSIIPDHNFKYKGKGEVSMKMVQDYKNWKGFDHVLKKNNKFIFVNNIEDVEIIEE